MALQPPRPSSTCCSSSTSSSDSDSDSDQDWADWVEDEGQINYDREGLTISSDSQHNTSNPTSRGPKLPTLALFADKEGKKQTFASPMEAIQHGRENFEVDLLQVVQRCGESEW